MDEAGVVRPRLGPGRIGGRLAVALVSVLVIACGGSNGDAALPRLAVTFARTPVPIALNAYCWHAPSNNRCVDGVSIQSEVLSKGLDAIRVLPGSAGQITFDRSPTAVNLTAGQDADNLASIAVSRGTFRAPSAPGHYAFRVRGRWPEGDASWVFVVTVAAT